MIPLKITVKERRPSTVELDALMENRSHGSFDNSGYRFFDKAVFTRLGQVQSKRWSRCLPRCYTSMDMMYRILGLVLGFLLCRFESLDSLLLCSQQFEIIVLSLSQGV